MTFALLEFDRHRDWLTRVREEIDNVLRQNNVSKVTQLDFDSFQQLPLLQAFFKEVLRIHPSVPVRQRSLVEKVFLFFVFFCFAFLILKKMFNANFIFKNNNTFSILLKNMEQLLFQIATKVFCFHSLRIQSIIWLRNGPILINSILLDFSRTNQ